MRSKNDMLLTQVMQRHQAAIAQILQGLANPGMPPEMKAYLIGVIYANGQLMSNILKNFGKDDIARLQPELEIVKKLMEGAKQNAGQQNGGGQPQPSPQQQGPQSPPPNIYGGG